MDFKQQLDQMFDDREAKLKSEQAEKNAKAEAAAAQRNRAITFINTTLEPTLKEFVRTIKAKGVDIDCTIDKTSALVGASVTMHVESTDRTVSWQASSLTFRFLDGIQLSADVWGRGGRTPIQALPTGARVETADRDFIERVLVRFAKTVLNASE